MASITYWQQLQPSPRDASIAWVAGLRAHHLTHRQAEGRGDRQRNSHAR